MSSNLLCALYPIAPTMTDTQVIQVIRATFDERLDVVNLAVITHQSFAVVALAALVLI